MPGRWRPHHAPGCQKSKEYVQSAALALKTRDAGGRGTFVCRPCQSFSRWAMSKYELARRLGYSPSGYEDLLRLMHDEKVDARLRGGFLSKDRKVSGTDHPRWVAQKGNPAGLIAARRAGRGGLSGAAKSRAMLVASWRPVVLTGKRRGQPRAVKCEIDLCEVCGHLLMRGTSRGVRRVVAHQPCWWEVQRSPEGRAWMATYMDAARSGRRSFAPRPGAARSAGKKASPATLTAHFGWAVRHHLGGESFAVLAASENFTAQAVHKAVERIVELLPPVERASRQMARYVLAFNEVLGRSSGTPKPLRRGIAACGTPSGYSRHRRRGEKACDACAQAERERTRAYSEKRRREAGARQYRPRARALEAATPDAAN